MSTSIQNSLTLAGRVLLAQLFLFAGISKLTGFAGTVGYITSVGLPMPTVAAAVALVVEIVGGLALLFGFGTRLAALALALFTAVASVFFHNYWGVPTDQVMVQQLMFYKNVAVIGGLLVLAGQGAGALSLDARRSGN